MKVLYVGPYRDGTGWAEAAIRVITALDTAGVDLVIRPFRHNQNVAELPKRLLELEKNSSRGADVVIQNVLPHYMEYNSAFKNIGFYWTETSFRATSWAKHLNFMDQAWVPNYDAKENGIQAGVKTPIKVIRVPALAQEVYDKQYERPKLSNLDDKFVFYFIGEATRRKNLNALLLAFHTEFDPHENVELVLKANISGMIPQESYVEVQKLCEGIKRGLRMYKTLNDYKSEIIITDRWTESQIFGLHQAADCFVSSSSGEGLCLPMLDATFFGNKIISTNGDHVSWFDHGVRTVKAKKEPCFGMSRTFDDLYTGHDDWLNVDITDLRKAMRSMFRAGKDKLLRKVDYGFNSYKAAGNLMLENLSEA